MRRSRAVFWLLSSLALLAASVSPVFAQQDAVPVPIEEWSLEKVSRLGVEIYEQDRAAWLASDVLVANVDEDKLPRGGGWIVVPDPGGRKVRFVRQDGGAFHAVWDVVVGRDGAGPLITVGESGVGISLKPEEIAQFKARQTAMDNIGRLQCSQNLNTVVYDDPDSDGWLVWLLTSTQEDGVVPVGGHYRFRISGDGKMVLRRDMLSNSCLAMQRPEDTQQETAGLFVSQIVSSGPVETHVFLSILNRLPIYVIAPDDRLFEVLGPNIKDVTDLMRQGS